MNDGKTPLSFYQMLNLSPIKIPPICLQNDSFASQLQTIENQLKNNIQPFNIVSSSFWKHLLSKFYNFHLNHYQKLQLLQLLSKLINVNFGIQKVQDEIQFSGDAGFKFHKLQNSLYFKHKHSFQYLQFMSNKIYHRQANNIFRFSDLQFDLSIEETQKVAAQVRTFCQYDMKAFSFLSLYLQISVKNRATKQPLQKIQQEYKTQLQNLAKKYPPNDFEVYGQKKLPRLQKIRSSYKMQQYFFENNGSSHFEELKNLIIKKAQDAKKDQQLFQKLVKDICYQKGYGFKSGVKIKSPQNTVSILRTIQKLIQEYIEKNKQNTSPSNQRNILTFKNQKISSSQLLKYLIQKEKKQSQKKIQQILQSQNSIVFDSKDLVRGKCTFSTVQDVAYTVKLLTNHIKNKGFKVIELKDRLQSPTKDAVIIIKLADSIAELQLAVKLDSVANQFNHKIYELKRSKLYSPITNLFIHNQIWCQSFFTQQIELFQGIYKQNNNSNSQWKSKFKDYKFDMQQFKNNYLKSNQINYQKQKYIRRQQSNKEKQQISKIMKVIKDKNYQNINKQHRQKYQKVHQVKFFKQNIDYEKGMELVYCIYLDQQSNNTYLLKLKGDIYHQKGQLKQALNCYTKCVQLYQKSQTKSDSQTSIYASVLNQIGLVYWNSGNYTQSLINFQKCLNIKIQINGLNSIDTATLLNNIGGVYENKGNYKKALQHYQKSLNIKIKQKGNQSIQVANTLNNIGSVYQSMGNFNKALQNYQKSLDIKTKIKGKDSIQVATTLNNIGSAYDNKGDYNKALEYYTKCLNIKEKIKGKDSIDVSFTLNNIGVVCQHKGALNQALQNYQKCLNIQIKLKGQNSIDVATTMNNIGLIYTKNANYANALEYYQKCLNIQRKVKGQNSIDVATTLNNIGYLYWSQGDLQKASSNYQKCLQIQIKIKGQNSIDVATTLNNIGSLYQKKKDYKKALQNFQRCLKIQEKAIGTDSIDIATLLNNIGSVYDQKGDLHKALQHYERSLNIKIKIRGQNSMDVATTLNNLSFVYEKMNLLQKSYECARKSYEIRKQTLGEGHSYTKSTLRQFQKVQNIFKKKLF